MFYNILLPSAYSEGKPTRGTKHAGKVEESANCKAETLLQGRKTDMRMKPDWLNENPSVCEVTMTESSYIRHIAALRQTAFIGAAGTCRDEAAVSGEKGVSRIRQSVVPTVVTCAKRRLPKLKRPNRAMSVGSEYSAWQRSPHSSLSKGKPCTWRRGAVSTSILLTDNVRDV